jgi:hypothetical protein
MSVDSHKYVRFVNLCVTGVWQQRGASVLEVPMDFAIKLAQQLTLMNFFCFESAKPISKTKCLIVSKPYKH